METTEVTFSYDFNVTEATLAGVLLLYSSLNTVCITEECTEPVGISFDSVAQKSYDKSGKINELAKELKGQTLKVATLKNNPLSNYETLKDGTINGTGVAFDFLRVLAEKYEFNYTVSVPKENVLGGDNGIMAMLDKQEVDIAAAFLPIFPWYRDKVNYSVQLDMGNWLVIMKRPTESATGSGLLAPFDYVVWILIIISVAAVGPVFYLIIKLRARLCPEDENGTVYSWQECVWFVYGALLKQGSVLSPATDSARLLFATWWIFITILTAFYTANLTAFLTLSKFTLPIEKKEDIANKGFSWVTQAGQAVQEVIDHSRELAFLDNKKYRIFSKDNDEEIMKTYVDKSRMYIRDQPAINYIIYRDYLFRRRTEVKKNDKPIKEEQRCVYVLTKWPVIALPRGFAYKKNFKFHELFDLVLSSLVESGIVKYKQFWDMPDTEVCPLDLADKSRKMKVTDLLLTFEIVLGGFGTAAVIFVIEFVYRRCIAPPSGSAPTRKPLHSQADFFNSKADHLFVPPPPSYHTLFQTPLGTPPDGKKKIINGRDYWVIKATNGDTRLIPVRTPSALLFQYTQ